MSTSSATFGPSALATPANAVTIARLALAPILVATIVDRGPSWVTLALWFLLAVTDGVDGWVARRQGATRSGAFLDPLADKVLVLGAMFALVGRGRFWLAPVVLLASREVGVSAYRAWAGQRGVSIPARWGAKLKTVVEDLAVGFAVMPATADHRLVATTVLWVSVLLALWTGGQYLADARTMAGADIRAV
ncbi:MAG TPA: CDP-alcohol phosphatidyltransferase family protein [Acidimicrobiales bacterium]